METESTIDSQDTVYHYTGIDKALHILHDRRLKFSTGAKTNDPREYQDWYLEPDSDGLTFEEHSQTRRAMQKSLTKALACYKYVCFCQNDISNSVQLEPGYAKPRMWAQYGENFYGACIAFSSPYLCKQLRDNNIFVKAQRVDCDKDLKGLDFRVLQVSMNEIIKEYKNDSDAWATDYIKHRVDQFFFSKHKDYEGENEYRILVHTPTACIEDFDISDCIKAVIIGDRTAPAHCTIIKYLCKKINAECKQAVWDKGRFRLRDV